MLSEVSQLLEIDLSVDRVVSLIHRPPVSCAFLICHVLHVAAREARHVLLLAVAQPVRHYRHLCAKMGAGALFDRHVCAIDAEQLILSTVNDQASDGCLAARAVYAKLAKELQDDSVLLIDGVSVLRDMLPSHADQSFDGDEDAMPRDGGECGQLSLLLCNILHRALQSPLACVVMVTEVDEEDLPLARVCASLENWSDLSVEVRPLVTGQCAEVTGVMEVRRRLRPPHTCQFRAQDKNVRVFAVGTSSAVL